MLCTHDKRIVYSIVQNSTTDFQNDSQMVFDATLCGGFAVYQKILLCEFSQKAAVIPCNQATIIQRFTENVSEANQQQPIL